MAEARGDPCVVIVEDEPQIRRFLRAALAGQSFRVHEAGTGADGLVEVASRQPDVVVLDLGLPAGQEQKIFDKFYGVGAGGGAGLGLTICRAIVEAHGGRIGGQPRPGGGALFRFSLPAGEPPRPPESPGG